MNVNFTSICVVVFEVFQNTRSARFIRFKTLTLRARVYYL